MITKTIPNAENSAGDTPFVYYGLSTDSKPTTDVPNGSAFVEMNAGKLYFFNASASTWVEFKAQEE